MFFVVGLVFLLRFSVFFSFWMDASVLAPHLFSESSVLFIYLK